jgi:hypothetical protein
MNSIHDLRLLNVALLDLLMTVAIAALVSWRTKFRFRWVLPVCLGVAVLVHWALGEPTTLNHALGLSPKPLRHREKPQFIDIVPE